MARSVALTPRWAMAVIDVVLVALVAGAGIWRELTVHLQFLVELSTGGRIAVQIVAALLLLGRRRRAITIGAIIAVLSLLTPTYASVVVPFAAFAYGSNSVRSSAVSVAALGTWLLGAQGWLLIDPVSTVALHASSAVLGLYARQRVALAESLVQRAERAEREEVLLAEQAVLAERVRLAGEMHDTVSHRITLVLLQAGALEVGPTTETDVREAAQRIRVSAGHALDDLRGLLDVLGSTPTDPAHQGSAPLHLRSSLTELVDRARAAGMTIDLRVADLRGDLDPAIGHACVRIVEEGLTNAARHACGSPVGVAVDVDHHDAETGWLTVSISTRPAVVSKTLPIGSGTGLTRMKRRVGLLGGRLTVTEETDGGHLLRATLPLVSHSAVLAPALAALPR